jgi:hypothetical protein
VVRVLAVNWCVLKVILGKSWEFQVPKEAPCKEMQVKGINVSAQLSNNERHPMSHKAADEVHVVAETVQLERRRC